MNDAKQSAHKVMHFYDNFYCSLFSFKIENSDKYLSAASGFELFLTWFYQYKIILNRQMFWKRLNDKKGPQPCHMYDLCKFSIIEIESQDWIITWMRYYVYFSS